MNQYLRSITIIIIFALTLIGKSHGQEIDYKAFPEWSWGKKDSTEYMLYTPSKREQGKKYPLVLFLHGCCGQDYKATPRNAVDPPVRVWHNFGENTQRIPTFILSPKTKRGWRQHFPNLKSVMDELVANGSVDPQRIYISGFSMGAQGTWEFIEEHPQYFAAGIPMGMDFKGKDPENFKHIPIWTIRGENDWWARHLGTQVVNIRKLHIPNADSSQWITGINPRFTSFENMEHGVMWPAVQRLDLLSWMYEKVNDGNNYPTVVLKAPAYKQQVLEGKKVKIVVDAFDDDESVSRVEILINGKLAKTIVKPPYTTTFVATPGDIEIKAIAYDNKNKSAYATGKVWVDVPCSIITTNLPEISAGKWHEHQLQAKGNGKISFTLSADESLPQGLMLSSEGNITGIPVKSGKYAITFSATDENGDKNEKKFSLTVREKESDVVLITNCKDYRGMSLPLAKVRKGVSPLLRGDDEVTFSGDLGKYEDLTLIKTTFNDTIDAKPYYLSFDADEDVTVYIAYEKLEKPAPSTIPAWLKQYRHEPDQLTTQYYYYDIYSKDFPKGEITLPDAEEKNNRVNTNYFVMVRKKS